MDKHNQLDNDIFFISRRTIIYNLHITKYIIMSKQTKPDPTPIRERGLNPTPPPRERGGNQGINPTPPPKK